jgi:uncharacterized protein
MPDTPRTVVDTNLLVAYALLPPDAPRRHRAVKDGVEAALTRTQPLISSETAAELAHVLRRPAFEPLRPLALREAFLGAFLARALRIEEVAPVRLCRDPDDDMFLALAQAGEARWLVSLDKRLLAVRRIGDCRVVRPQTFLAALDGAG